MVYKNIDGILFKKIITDGCKNLKYNKNLINTLNVFPVPDGDTGTNMSMTLTTAVNEVNSVNSDKMEDVCNSLSRGALKGARGNSGVILSQILKGICEVLKENEIVSTKDFSKALKRGTEIAYSAVSKPKEGTMLTVIRVIAENSSRISNLNSNFCEFFNKLIEKGEEILAKTPDMLPVLKKAGTVDAGGKGIVEIFRGFYDSLMEIPIPEASEDETTLPKVEDTFLPDYTELGEIEFGYCTEFFVTNLNEKTTLADIDKLRDRLLEMGDSVLCIGDLHLIKVHIHTNNPGNALQYALRIGDIDKVKIENMREQNRKLIAEKKTEHKEKSMISICNGDGIKAMFKELGVEHIIDGGQTMNPSVDDILHMIKKANSDNIIIFPNNKNIILAVEQAKELTDTKIFLVPTINMLQGLRAAMAYNPTLTAEDNYNNMLSSYSNLKVAELTYAIKSTNIDGVDVKEGDYIGLDSKRLLVKGNKLDDTVIDLLAKVEAEKFDVITLYFGNNLSAEDADKTVVVIQEKYPNAEVLSQHGGQQHYFYLISLE